MYQNYIFDFYGTVSKVQTDEKALEKWKTLALLMGYNGAEYTAESLKDTYEKIVHKYMTRNNDTDYPDIDIEDVIYRLYKDAEVKPNPKVVRMTLKAFRAITTEQIELYDAVVTFIKRLNKEGKKVFLLDNGQRTFILSELKMFKLKRFFDGIYISSDFKMKKPDVRFLEHLLSTEGLKKEDTILIGNDYEEDVKMAKKVGVDCLYIHTESSNRKVKDEKAKFVIMDGDHSKIESLIG